MLDDRIATNTIDDAVSDAMHRLRKATNNHPSLDKGTPHRREVTRQIQRRLKDRKYTNDLTITNLRRLLVTVGEAQYQIDFHEYRLFAVRRIAE